jgi:hypothetical protein
MLVIEREAISSRIEHQSGGEQELMDSSLHSTHLVGNEVSTPLAADAHGSAGAEEEEHHVHLPNPSLWPFILSLAIIVALAGMLFIPSNPWMTIIALPFILIGILGWALEDPMAPVQEQLITVVVPRVISPFQLGQDVYDKDGNWLGRVAARFSDRYILVERGKLMIKKYYVPQSLAKISRKRNLVVLTASEQDLLQQGLSSLPDDLYEDVPDYGVPQVTGVPQFARRPLSPAETGHYNFGPNYPGINTDAAGSYYRDEVVPTPQRYVSERRKVYKDER